MVLSLLIAVLGVDDNDEDAVIDGLIKEMIFYDDNDGTKD